MPFSHFAELRFEALQSARMAHPEMRNSSEGPASPPLFQKLNDTTRDDNWFLEDLPHRVPKYEILYII